MALALAALLCAAAAYAPPYEGDAYEYAEVALHWVRHGSMTERHLRNYNIPDRRPGNPAAHRAGYYTVFMAPFVAAFGASPWSVFVPGLLGFLATVWVAYGAGRALFELGVGWWVALLLLFHPTLIYLLLLDPTPELWLAALCPFAVWMFLREKYAAAGVALGVACFVKLYAAAFLPAFFLYILLFKRAELRRGALWAGMLCFLLAAAPFLIRNTIIFGNPVYTEESRAREHFDPHSLIEHNTLQTTFQLRDREPPNARAGSPFENTVKLTGVNFHDYFLGMHHIDYQPGLAQLIFIASVPFFFVGLFAGRKHPAIRLFAICTFVYIGLLIPVVSPYDARHIFAILPLALFIAVYGVFALSKWFPSRTLLLIIFLIGPATTLPFVALQSANREEHGQAVEFLSACRWLESATPQNAVVMSWPPFATTFYSDRKAVPYPYGGVGELQRAIRIYGVNYVMFTDMTKSGELPRFDFLDPVSKGKYVSLFQVKRETHVDKSIDKRHSTEPGFAPLNDIYKFIMSLPLRMDWPVEKFLVGIIPVLPGIVLFFVFEILFIIYCIKRRGAVGGFAIAVVVIACIGARGAYIATLDRDKLNQPPPPVNVAQVRDMSGGADTIVIAGAHNEFKDYEAPLRRVFRKVRFVDEKTDVPDTDHTVWLVPVRERPRLLDDPAAVAAWQKQYTAAYRGALRRMAHVRRGGLVTIPVGGGLLLRHNGEFPAATIARPRGAG